MLWCVPTTTGRMAAPCCNSGGSNSSQAQVKGKGGCPGDTSCLMPWCISGALSCLRAPILAQLNISQSAMACALALSMSQNTEDLQLLPALMRASRQESGSTFVEMGALDGVTMSNTFMLQRCFGWRGLLVESNPVSFAKLSRSRSHGNTVLHSAVCKHSGTVRVTTANTPVSGEVGEMASSFKQLWHAERLTRSDKTVSVPCHPLPDMLSSTGLAASGVSFWSLDTEGAELKVLQTAGLATLSSFQLLMVEMDGHNPHKDLAVHKLLLSAGLVVPLVTAHLDVPFSQVYVQPRIMDAVVRLGRALGDYSQCIAEYRRCRARMGWPNPLRPHGREATWCPRLRTHAHAVTPAEGGTSAKVATSVVCRDHQA